MTISTQTPAIICRSNGSYLMNCANGEVFGSRAEDQRDRFRTIVLDTRGGIVDDILTYIDEASDKAAAWELQKSRMLAWCAGR